MFDLIVLLVCLAVVVPATAAAGFAFGVWLEARTYVPRWVPAWVLTAARVIREWSRGQ